MTKWTSRAALVGALLAGAVPAFAATTVTHPTSYTGDVLPITLAKDSLVAGASTSWVCFTNTDIAMQTTSTDSYASPFTPSYVSVYRSDTDPSVASNPADVTYSVVAGGGGVAYYREPGHAWWRVTFHSAGSVIIGPLSVSLTGHGC